MDEETRALVGLVQLSSMAHYSCSVAMWTMQPLTHSDFYRLLESSTMCRSRSRKLGRLDQLRFKVHLLHNEFMVVCGGFSDASINPFIWLFVWEDFPTQGFWCRAKTGFAPPPHLHLDSRN